MKSYRSLRISAHALKAFAWIDMVIGMLGVIWVLGVLWGGGDAASNQGLGLTLSVFMMGVLFFAGSEACFLLLEIRKRLIDSEHKVK